jgi:hypothetical protein
MYDTRFIKGFNRLLDKASQPIKIRYFTPTIGSVWDDEVTLTQSGTDLWTSGIPQSLELSRGSIDSNLLEQGKLIYNDSKLFIPGSIILTGSTYMIKIQIGSPTGENYTMIPEGTDDYTVEGTPTHKKAYIRRITTGSLLGE